MEQISIHVISNNLKQDLLLNKKKHSDALKFNKTDKLKQFESIILKKQTVDRLKEVKQLQNNIKLDYLEYSAKRGKPWRFSFSKY